MPTKISKVARDLNVGVSTAVEFLRKHNIEVDNNPNVRIDDAAVELLKKEYSNDKDSKDKSDKMSQARKSERKSAKGEPRNAEIKTTVPKQGLKILGKIDLDGAGKGEKPAKAEPAAGSENRRTGAQARGCETGTEDRAQAGTQGRSQTRPAASTTAQTGTEGRGESRS